MKSFSRTLSSAMLFSVAFATVGQADFFEPNHHGGTTRTYFGRPGTGPYGVPEQFQNPYTCKVFGFRFCKTPETREADYQRRLAAAEARAQVIVNRVQTRPMWGNLIGGACGGQCQCAPVKDDCFLFGHCKNKGCAGCGNYGPGGPGSPLPGMNREDAVRYLEGHQYYPPNHLLHSPRDFYMFDVKYGIGQ